MANKIREPQDKCIGMHISVPYYLLESVDLIARVTGETRSKVIRAMICNALSEGIHNSNSVTSFVAKWGDLKDED